MYIQHVVKWDMLPDEPIPGELYYELHCRRLIMIISSAPLQDEIRELFLWDFKYKRFSNLKIDEQIFSACYRPIGQHIIM